MSPVTNMNPPGQINADKVWVEPIREKDLDEIVRLEKECFSMPWTREMFASELADTRISNTYLVRWTDGQHIQDSSQSTDKYPICGYLVFWRIYDEIHIGSFAVAPDFRRRKIASYLIEFIIQKAREWAAEYMTLEVRESNAPAIKLYEKYGFKAVALRKEYYSKPIENAIVMVREEKSR